jgi:dihydroorotase/N-acyl-D-amino-acid deacylase
LLLLAVVPTISFAQYDLLIRNGRVIDGTGAPWFRADIAINGDSITAVGWLPSATAKQVIDADGLVVAPGFIDIHSHADRGLITVPVPEGIIRDGVTTVIGGNDGSSAVPLGPFLKKVADAKPAINFGSFVGQGSVRSAVMGLVNRPATPDEIGKMKGLVRTAMQDGALGLSTGLFYVPGNFTPTEEVIELAKVAGAMGGMHISHMRDEMAHIVDSVNETIRIGEGGHLPTQVSHHKVIGPKNWGLSRETLRLVDEARARGVDVTIDQYPYTASSTGTAAMFPQWSLEGGNRSLVERLGAPEQRAKIRSAIVSAIADGRGGGDPKNVVLASCSFDKALASKSLADLVAVKHQPVTLENAAEVAIDLQSKGGCSAVYHAIGEEDIERIMRSPFSMFASDGGISVPGEGAPHPRNNGTFARVLGPYVRERKVISLENAIHKMSGYPAARLKLMDRGLIRPGMKADIVVFDPATVRDRATYTEPHLYSEGIRDVIVNGERVLKGGGLTGARPGRVLGLH